MQIIGDVCADIRIRTAFRATRIPSMRAFGGRSLINPIGLLQQPLKDVGLVLRIRNSGIFRSAVDAGDIVSTHDAPMGHPIGLVDPLFDPGE